MKRYGIAAFVLAGIFGLAGQASAQVYYPGTVWSTTGTLSPVEKGNVISQSYVEQGIAYKGASLFAASTLIADSKGYDWNRRVTMGGGVRLTQNILTGVVRVNLVYLREQRYVSPAVHVGLALSVDAWFGWGQRPAGPTAGAVLTAVKLLQNLTEGN